MSSTTALAPIAEPKVYTLEEYFKLEEQATSKHGFDNGTIVDMPGGTYNHNLIALTIGALLFNAVKNLPKIYRVLSSDMKIRIEEYNEVLYADALVICEKPEFFAGRKDVITNPMLIVEVLSKSTEGYDVGAKLEKYFTLDSFQQYVLVRQDRPEISILHKEEPDLWRRTVVKGLDASLSLKSLPAILAMSDIYDGIEF